MGILVLLGALLFGTHEAYANGWDLDFKLILADLAASTAGIRATAGRKLHEYFVRGSNGLARVSLALLACGMGAIFVVIMCDLIKWQMAVPALCFNALALAVVLTGANADPTNPKATTSFGRSLGALYGFGVVTFVNGLMIGSHELAYIGTAFDCIVAPWLTFLVMWPVLRLARGGFDLLEFTSNKGIDFAAGWQDMFKFMKSEPKPGANVNIVDQEDLDQKPIKVLIAYTGYLATLHIIGINIPDARVASLVVGAGMTTYLGWKACQAEGIDVTGQRRFTALLVNLLATAFTTYIAYQIVSLIFPTQVAGLKVWAVAHKWAFFDEKPAQWILGLSLLAAVLIGWLWHPHVKTDKGHIAELPLKLYGRHAVFGLMLFLAGYAGFSLYLGYTHGFSHNAYSVQNGLTTGTVARPTAEGKLVSPTEAKLKFSWTPVAKAYQLEARTASGPFMPFRGQIGEGIGHYETMFTQPAVAPKKGNAVLEKESYFFRIIALNEDGSRLAASSEVEVKFDTFAPAPAQPAASGSASIGVVVVVSKSSTTTVVVPPPVIVTPPAPAAPPARRIPAGAIRLPSFTTASR